MIALPLNLLLDPAKMLKHDLYISTAVCNVQITKWSDPEMSS